MESRLYIISDHEYEKKVESLGGRAQYLDLHINGNKKEIAIVLKEQDGYGYPNYYLMHSIAVRLLTEKKPSDRASNSPTTKAKTSL